MRKQSNQPSSLSENQKISNTDKGSLCKSSRLSIRRCSFKQLAHLHHGHITRRLTQLPLNQTPDLLKQGSLPPLLSPSRQSFLVKPSHRDIVELAKLIVSLPVKINFLSKVMNLPLFSETRKTLIIDLDETLTHTVKKDESSQVTLEIKEAEKISINVRPFVIEFLKFASNEFEVVVFTASKQKYADTILDYLDPTGKLIHYRLYREQCYCFNGNFIKDIRILGGRDMRNVIIVDNTLNSFALQVENGIPITTWTSDPKDQQLKLLIDYLKILKIARDVRTVNRNTFGISNLVNGEIILSRNQNVTLSN